MLRTCRCYRESILSPDDPIEPTHHPKRKTCVTISVSAWQWLKRKARDEAEREGGRPNASAILERLIRDAATRI